MIEKPPAIYLSVPHYYETHLDWSLTLDSWPWTKEHQENVLRRENPSAVWEFLRTSRSFNVNGERIQDAARGMDTVFVHVQYKEPGRKWLTTAKLRVDSPLRNPKCSWVQ